VPALLGAMKHRPAAAPTCEGTRFAASVYALNLKEGFAPGVAGPVRSGPTTVLTAGEQFAGRVMAQPAIEPGGTGAIRVDFPRPVRLAVGQRFVLLNNGHVIAAGVFMEADGGR
jgi:translation elongation factor EF-Tu-like GTPase